MKTTTRTWASLLIPFVLLTGCSTTSSYRPTNLTEKQYSQKMNDLSQVCRTFKQGDYVSVTFYEGAPGVATKTVAGYFYAYNKLGETISLASKYMEYSDRGEPYNLKYISDIVPTQDPVAHVYKPNFLVRAITNFFTVKEHDNEKAILTQ